MKYISHAFILLLSVLMIQCTPAQNVQTMEFDDYKDLWSNYEKQLKSGRFDDATSVLEEIENTAKEDNNDPQILKVLFHGNLIRNLREEDSFIKNIEKISNTLPALSPIGQAVGKSMLANSLDDYFRQNMYKINQLTQTEEKPGDNIAAWTSRTFIDTIATLYFESLTEETKKYSSESYSAIIDNVHKNGQKYRPTIYDLLSHEAISYFTNMRSMVTSTTQEFILDDAKVFAKSREFIKHEFNTEDLELIDSNILSVIELFQELESLHLQNEEVLLDIVSKRLQFANQHSIHSDKDNLYKNSLLTYYKDYKKVPKSAEFLNYLVDYYINKAGQYNYGQDSIYRDYYAEAIAFIEKGVKEYPGTDYEKVFIQKKEKIFQSTIQGQMEDFVPINQPSKFYLSYRNVDEVKVQILKLTIDQLKTYYGIRYDQKLSLVKKGKKVQELTFQLPYYDDYHNHDVEIPLPALDSGIYGLIISQNGNKSVHVFQSTNISVHTSNNTITLLHSDTGSPFEGAEIEMYKSDYNRNQRILNSIGSILVTDEYGNAPLENNRPNALHIKHENDEAFIFHSYYGANRNYSNSQDKYALFFTDRSIYRPNQKVHWKLIAYSNYPNTNPKTIANEKVKITFRDANNQEIESETSTTNEFGSLNGTFSIPKTGLNGNYRIQIESGGRQIAYQSIQVEEYKRPKFEVITDTINQGFELNEELIISGIAKAFSGQPIDLATVRYEVMRKEYHRYFRWYGFPTSSDKLIAFGETATDKLGEFNFEFITEPDKSVMNGLDKTYLYEVTIDVTDSNGETRSTTTVVKASKWSAFIDLEDIEMIDISKKSILEVSVKNIMNQSLDQEVSYEIFQLDEPANVKREKKWKIPQDQILSKESYSTQYPYDYYSEEDVWKNSIGTKIKEGKSTSQVPLGSLSSGTYKVIFNTDKGMETIQYLTIVNSEEKQFPKTFEWNVNTNKDSYQPGDTAVITIQSPHEELIVRYYVKRMNEAFDEKMVTVQNQATIEIPIIKNDFGGLQLVLYTVKHHINYKERIHLQVPYDHLDLHMKWETFRSTLEPNSKEKWKIKITNKDGKPISSEVVASMYDQSLDQFKNHKWNQFRLLSNQGYLDVNGLTYGSGSFSAMEKNPAYHSVKPIEYPKLIYSRYAYSNRILSKRSNVLNEEQVTWASVSPSVAKDESVESDGMGAMMNAEESEPVSDIENQNSEMDKEIQNPIRSNLDETVFFYPDLTTNEKGEVFIEFTMNEALTEWKLQTFAHTNNLEHVLDQQSIVTKKDLMVFPNGPRFFKQNDKITFPAKIVNLADETINGEVEIVIKDALTNTVITDDWLQKNSQKQAFTIDQASSRSVFWDLEIPKDSPTAVIYQVIAKTDKHTDGEEHSTIVLENRSLVTESLPITIQSNETKNIHFSALDKVNTSNTLVSERYNLSFTSNPTWLAVQSLPYLMEYPHKCSEQIFARYFANTLGNHILQQNPKIEKVYAEWKEKDEFVSALNKNQELKSALIEETPWLMDALDEEEQMERMATLFDLSRIKSESYGILQELNDRQRGGGWPWFPGGRPSWYITQYILEGFGQLEKIGLQPENERYENMIKSSIAFLDAEFLEYYERNKKDKLLLKPLLIHYLYVKSFFPQYSSEKVVKAVSDYMKIAKNSWLDQNLMSQAHLAIVFQRTQNEEDAVKIIESLRQRSIRDNELGMYWKETNGYLWYQSGIEMQASLLTAFEEVDPLQNEIDQMKVWLLRNKQTNRWKSTKATTQAIYAIVEKGSSWLASTDLIKVKLNGSEVNFESNTGSNIGFIEKSYSQDITSSMADIEVSNPNNHLAWGSVTFQYWEDQDKIVDYQETPLELTRNFYKKVRTNKGETLVNIDEDSPLKVGEVLTVKLKVKVDRPMEFIHLKDMRASGMEPVDVISGYKWKAGLGYYMETKDVSTNFFIDNLPRGEYIIEYDVLVAQAGDFSGGIATIQSMYAPEFGAHSAGTRIQASKQ